MELQTDITINGRHYRKGAQVPWYWIYPFFMLHMAIFGLSGFFMAYADNGPELEFLYMHGGIACLVYVVFYVALFGIDRVKWMFINAGLGLFGIYAQIDLLLSLFGKRAGDFSTAVHTIPFLYYVLYTFLLHQLLLDATRSRNNAQRRRMVDALYIGGSILVYGSIWLGSD
jgi:hypothetical protein